ncbi:putative membrane protein YccC [Desulfobaculum xiamenense]|uniref:Putative membrane protein YccC n=1 Tax=Desulfobaculum xiamenense TaxID=995050 RepID=A0A846QTC5_9BACT|nr:hypothetical protein [Desulfobaculum xiamenense]NJB68715.1 putative membrane protein YccC [Desulfobaculum xiamenense]
MIDTVNAHPSSAPGGVGRREAVDTGMAVTLACLIAFLFGAGRGFVAAATFALVLTMTWPAPFGPVARVWLGLSTALGTVASKVILTLVFYGLVTPMGIARRMLGCDVLKLRQWKRGDASVFDVRDTTYSAGDVERPY